MLCKSIPNPNVQLVLPTDTTFAITDDLLGQNALPQLLQRELQQHLMIKAGAWRFPAYSNSSEQQNLKCRQTCNGRCCNTLRCRHCHAAMVLAPGWCLSAESYKYMMILLFTASGGTGL